MAAATEGCRRVGANLRLLATGVRVTKKMPIVGRKVGPLGVGRITGTGVGLKVRTLRGLRDRLAAATGLLVLRPPRFGLVVLRPPRFGAKGRALDGRLVLAIAVVGTGLG